MPPLTFSQSRLEPVRGRSIGEVAGSHGRLLHDAVASVVASGPSFTTELRSQGRWFDVVVDPIVGETGKCPEP